MSEHPKPIQDSVGPTIGVSQVSPATSDWRLLIIYGIVALSGILLLAQ